MKSDSSSHDTARAWKWGMRREELKAHPGQRPHLGATLAFPSLDPHSQFPLGSWESHLDPGPRRAAHGPMRGPGSCELVWPHWPRKPCWLTCVGTPMLEGLQLSLCTQCHGGLSRESYSAFPKAHGDSGAPGLQPSLAGLCPYREPGEWQHQALGLLPSLT